MSTGLCSYTHEYLPAPVVLKPAETSFPPNKCPLWERVLDWTSLAQRDNLKTAWGSEGATVKHFSEITESAPMSSNGCNDHTLWPLLCFCQGMFSTGWPPLQGRQNTSAFAHRFFVPNNITFLLEVHGYSFFNVSLTILPKPPIPCHLSGGKRNVASTVLKDREACDEMRQIHITSQQLLSCDRLWIIRDYFMYSVETRKLKPHRLRNCSGVMKQKMLKPFLVLYTSDHNNRVFVVILFIQ